MFSSIPSRTGAVLTAVAALTSGSILRGGVAAGDPNQDEQFLSLLDQEGIPAIENVPGLINTAHKVCRKLDGGMPVDALVDLMMNNAYGVDPSKRLVPGRVERTEDRFITAAVLAYCPQDQGNIGSLMKSPTPGSNDSTVHRKAIIEDHRDGSTMSTILNPYPGQAHTVLEVKSQGIFRRVTVCGAFWRAGD